MKTLVLIYNARFFQGGGFGDYIGITLGFGDYTFMQVFISTRLVEK